MNKLALLSLSGDLKRICQSIQRSSPHSTKRFVEEAEKWLDDAKENNKPMWEMFVKIESVLKSDDNLKKAEDCLMYSVLLQNRAVS